MNKLVKYAPFSLPLLVGLGFTWIGACLVRNEKNINERILELEIQLHSK